MLLSSWTQGISYNSFSELSWVTELSLLEHHVTDCSAWQKEHVQGWEVEAGSVVYDIKP